MRKLTIVFFEAGGGHRNAADALKTALESQQNPWHVSLLNIQALLDSLDLVRNTTGIRLQDVYNVILRRGWTRLSPQLHVYHSRTVKAVRKYWMENPADLVLSVIPHFNRALAESLQDHSPQIPFVTLLTDFADYPPHFWIEKESQYLICGTEQAKQQALAMGHSQNHVFETSGMVLKAKFYEKPSLDRAKEREKVGLNPDMRTGIVLFGGHGSPAMLDIAKSLNACGGKLQLIMLCGHNQKLAAELRSMPHSMPMVVEEFTPRVDYFMSLADFFIGKPGPGCISEALQFDLPLIVDCNSRTLPQERYNTVWLKEKRLGIVLNSFGEIANGVNELLADATFQEFQINAKRYTNRALFEIPVILDEVFERNTSYSLTTRTFAQPANYTNVWATP